MDGYEWDPAKAAANLKKHKVDFADAALSLEDQNAVTRSVLFVLRLIQREECL